MPHSTIHRFILGENAVGKSKYNPLNIYLLKFAVYCLIVFFFNFVIHSNVAKI